MSFADQVTKVELFFVAVVKDKIFQIDNTYDIVNRVIVNRHTCKFMFRKFRKKVIIRSIYFYHTDVKTGNHDIFGDGIPKIHDVCDHFAFFTFQNTFFVADINKCTKFVLRNL